MKDKLLFIADGHHRYETALNYRRTRRQQAGAPSTPQPYDNVLMLFASLEDKGLTVLPTHRILTTELPKPAELVRRLESIFDITPLPFQPSTEPQVRGQFIDMLRSRGQSIPMFGLALKEDPQYYLLALKTAHRPSAAASPRDRLDVSLLQQHVVATLCPTQQEQEAMRYSKDDHESLNWVRAGHRYRGLVAESDESRRSAGRGLSRRTDASQVDLFLPQAAYRAGHERDGRMSRTVA